MFGNLAGTDRRHKPSGNQWERRKSAEIFSCPKVIFFQFFFRVISLCSCILTSFCINEQGQGIADVQMGPGLALSL